MERGRSAPEQHMLRLDSTSLWCAVVWAHKLAIKIIVSSRAYCYQCLTPFYVLDKSARL